jgi:hypothetical protein
MYIRHMLVVLHHNIHVMITVIIQAKFERMNVQNSFCGMYLMTFLIVHSEKPLAVPVAFVLPSVQLEEVSAALLTH